MGKLRQLKLKSVVNECRERTKSRIYRRAEQDMNIETDGGQSTQSQVKSEDKMPNSNKGSMYEIWR